MFLEFFSAVISCAMDDTYAMNLEEIKTGDINRFKNKLAFFNKKCTGFLKISQLQKFMYKIGQPLGISSLKISDFISVCSLLKIYTYTYEGEHYVSFYDVLIELSKYYLIHKTVEDEYNFNNDKVIYNNIEEVIECKTETLIKYLYAINEIQEEHFCQILNPYNLNKKYSEVYQINEWKKILKVIEEEEFRSDLTDYAFSFSRRIMVDVRNSNLKNKIPTNRMAIHEMDQSIIKEEYSKSKSNNSESELIKMKIVLLINLLLLYIK